MRLDLSEAASVNYLYGSDMPTIPGLGEAFRHAVEEGCAGRPLKARISPGDKVTIILSDITRFWMRQDRVCELLVKYLESVCGVACGGDIAVLVALGTHRPMTEKSWKRSPAPTSTPAAAWPTTTATRPASWT